MKMLLVIPMRFMRKNKGQTISILLGMVLSVAMIVAVSSLMHSAQMNKRESDRGRYGDYHYYFWSDDKLKKDILRQKKAGGFTFPKVQMAEFKEGQKTEENAKFLFLYANQACRKMMNREMIEGSYSCCR